MFSPDGMTFSGRRFAKDEIAQISEIVITCSGLSRTELANTICELFSWKRPSGKLKTVECRQFLEYLDHPYPNIDHGRMVPKFNDVITTISTISVNAS